MQLGQPIQGVHPGDSGQSALEFVLGDAATVPPDRGNFFPVTRRMHPDVCRFISEAVYDGRLHAEAGNAAQGIVLSVGADTALRKSGSSFVPVFHPLLVPAERFELPTYGLQNRCTTTVLSRHIQ